MPEKSPFLGSISGETTESGQPTALKAVGSFDTEAERNTPESKNSRLQRLYSDDDEDIRMAKAMAMAIQNNPNLKPDEVQKMVAEQFHRESQYQEVEEKKKKQVQAKSHPLATAIQTFKDEHFKDDPQNPFHSLHDSMLKTREMAEKKLQEMVGAPTNSSISSINTASTSNTAAKAPSERTVTIQAPPSPEKPAKAVAPAPGAMQLPNLHQMASSLTQSVDKETTERLNAAPLRLEALVWKRRSGMGKFNKNSWERRRMVVRGNFIAYYKAETTLNDDLELEPSPSHEEMIKGKSWLEQAAMNLSSMNGLGLSMQGEDPKLPRGCMDLVKERATIGASEGAHTSSPTPFCLSIKVRGETKWKLGFDSHLVQMEWLAAITDLVVKASVDAYNTQLLQQLSSSNSGLRFTSKTQVFPPPPGQDEDESGQWKLDEYKISAITKENDHGKDEEIVRKKEPPPAVDDHEDIVKERSAMIISEEETLEVSRDTTSLNAQTQDVWTLKQSDLYVAATIVNVALLFSHASSTTPNRFWHIATFANLGLWFLLSKQEPSKNQEILKTTTTTTTTNQSITLVESEVSAESVQPEEKAFKPLAGSTSIKVDDPMDSGMRNGVKFARWRERPGDILHVRSHGYKKTGKKVPSPGSIYDLCNVDIFNSPKRYGDMAKLVTLPEVKFHDDSKTWHSPDLFIISLSFPTTAPSSPFAPSTEDGEGYTVTMYFKMRDDTREILRRVTAEGYIPSQEVVGDVQKSKVNAVRLFEEWCRRAPTEDEYLARFKFVPAIQNVKEAGLPSWMSGYNGKPLLIKRRDKTGFLYNHPEFSAMEFDLSLHPFPYVAKQGFQYLSQHIFRKFVVAFGFVIESREEDELPECLIGLAEICYPDPKDCIRDSDLFSGKSPKSHELE